LQIHTFLKVDEMLWTNMTISYIMNCTYVLVKITYSTSVTYN